METITERQKKVIEFLKSYRKTRGYPPTMREIGEHFGFTWPAARGHLEALERKGFVRMIPNTSRGIEILGEEGSEARAIPLAGTIRAGRPLVAVEEREDHILVDKDFFRSPEAFALRVTGESMIEAGILEGDLVIVNPQSNIGRGEIGVVMIGEEATVKKVFMDRRSVRLVPANRTMKPATYPPDEVRIVGRVVGVIRKL